MKQKPTTTITYKLAKELKDVGFSQQLNGGKYYPSREDTRNYYIPTLEELIEACGGQMLQLNNWMPRCWNVVGVIKESIEDFEGKTPSEAVARLWLAINTKNDPS